MRITAFSDDKRIMDTSLDNLTLINPKVTQEDNKVGSFVFTIYPDHPYYNNILRMKSIITVYEEGVAEPLFRGRVYAEKIGFYNEKQVSCEGELAFLLDSIVRPYEFPAGTQTGTPAELFAQYIANHNSQVDASRQFKVGNVTVTDPNDYIRRSSTNYTSTWEELNAKLIKPLGGHLWVRHETDGNYIDYLADFNVLSNQKIEFGKNLIDLKKNYKADSFATAVIPLGARLKDEQGNDTGIRLTIASANNNIDYLTNADAVANYGMIVTTKVWDDVTEPLNLKRKGQAFIDDIAQFIASVEVSAADLNGATLDGEVVDVNSFRIGRYVKVNTKPHSIQNLNFIVTKLTRDLLKPESTKLILGTTYKTLTDGQFSHMEQLNQYVQTVTEEVKEVSQNANNSIALMIQRFTNEIQSSEKNIRQSLTESYYSKESVDSLLKSISTTFEQTAIGFEMLFNTISKNIDDVSNNADARFENISKYIRFIDGNIVLGEAGSELTLKLVNNRIQFLQNNTEVAYFTNKKLYVTDGEFLNSLQLGKFAFIPRNNGNLSFKKVIH